jgi:hypothetical protein
LTADKGFNWEHEYPRRFHADYKERHGGKHPTVVTTWWTLEDDDKVAVAEELGRNALTGSEITVTKGYDNIVYWTVPYNEAAIVEHFVNGSDCMGRRKPLLEELRPSLL